MSTPTQQILPILLTAAMTAVFGTTSYFISHQDDRIQQNLEKIEAIEQGQHQIRERLRGIETDTSYIKRDIGEAKDGIQEIERLLRDAIGRNPER